MTIIELNKRFYPIPTSWNELSQKQLLEVMDTLLFKNYSAEQALLKLVKILCNMNYWQFFRVKPAEFSEFFYLTVFLFSQPTGFTKQLIPIHENFFGPDDSFSNLTMQELVFSDSYFMQWSEDKENVAVLNELCATLYRPGRKGYDFEKNPAGDKRIEHNQNLCSWNAKHIVSKWPMNLKTAIATWYDGCRWELVEENKDIFGGDSSETAKYGLISVMMSVAENNVLGNFKEVEKQLVHLVMMQINESIAKAKALEKSIPK